jgi:hypothetical protein
MSDAPSNAAAAARLLEPCRGEIETGAVYELMRLSSNP